MPTHQMPHHPRASFRTPSLGGLLGFEDGAHATFTERADAVGVASDPRRVSSSGERSRLFTLPATSTVNAPYLIGARALNSSNQLRTTLISADSSRAVLAFASAGSTTIKRLPSGITSFRTSRDAFRESGAQGSGRDYTCARHLRQAIRGVPWAYFGVGRQLRMSVRPKDEAGAPPG